MHIILSRAVWTAGAMRTAIFRHIPDDIPWEDQISGDGQAIVSIVHADLSEDVIAAINADSDVLDYIYIADPDAQISAEVSAKVRRSASRHGIPMDAMPETPTGADVMDAVKRRMLLSQILQESNFDTADKLERKTMERLAEAGFNVEEINEGDDQESRMKKVQKKKVQPGG